MARRKQWRKLTPSVDILDDGKHVDGWELEQNRHDDEDVEKINGDIGTVEHRHIDGWELTDDGKKKDKVKRKQKRNYRSLPNLVDSTDPKNTKSSEKNGAEVLPPPRGRTGSSRNVFKERKYSVIGNHKRNQSDAGLPSKYTAIDSRSQSSALTRAKWFQPPERKESSQLPPDSSQQKNESETLSPERKRSKFLRRTRNWFQKDDGEFYRRRSIRIKEKTEEAPW